MAIQIVQVDAFTDRPFAGNPAAVCILEELPPDWWLQDVAREMNLSETAFLVRHSDGFDLRWFTPTTEVDLCGHATLACAHVLWEDGHLGDAEVARFHTRSGLLTARRTNGWIEMDFPSQKVVEGEVSANLSKALGVPPVWVGRSETDLIVEVADEKTVRTLHPDMGLLALNEARAVIVTSRAVTESIDFVCRVFAPRYGIPEDPVTGSAYCALGPFWSARLQRNPLTAYQVSRRGGTVKVKVDGDGVVIAGQAVTVMRGTLFA